MSGSRYENPQSPQTASTLLGAVCRDVRSIIYPATTMDVLGLFARTCQKAEAETALPRLLHCAAFALPESWQQEDKTKLAAIPILKRHPQLLFQKGFTRLPSGQLVYGSPYQVILGSGVIWARKTIHEEIIPLIEGGEALALEQYIEQFPNPGCVLGSFTQEDLIALKKLMEQRNAQVSDDLQIKVLSMNDNEDAYTKVLFEKQELVVIHQLLSENKREDLCTKLCEAEMLYDDRNQAQIAQVIEDLKEIVAAISVDPCTNGKATQQRTIDAIRTLREHLAPQKGAIRTGLYSTPEIMKIIHHVYKQNFAPWSGDQLNLYSFVVIGGAERSASAVDAQCYKKGLSSFDIKTPPDRTLSYFSGPGRCAGLGSSSFVDVYYGAGACAGAHAARGVVTRLRGPIAKFLSSKQSELTKPTLRHPKPIREAKVSLCVIC
jgi:hypothetical protein